MTTVAYAEQCEQAYKLIYACQVVQPDDSPSSQVENWLQLIWQTNDVASTLALIFSFGNSLDGVPLALSNSAFNTAKGMIMGIVTTEDDDEDIQSLSLEHINVRESNRRETGWILLEGLLHLGNQWVSFKLTTIYKLWNSLFCKDMCNVNI